MDKSLVAAEPAADALRYQLLETIRQFAAERLAKAGGDEASAAEAAYCVHHRGFGFHAQACAPGIVALLQPVRSREGFVLELGCGSGLLTRELTSAGHRVIATDASLAMLDLARGYAHRR